MATMMHPMRVEWTVPDEEKRAAARALVGREVERSRNYRDSDLYQAIAALSFDEQAEFLARRYPDLHAEIVPPTQIVRYGTLLSIRYVPEQWAAATYARGGLDLGTVGAAPVKLCEAKWVALVAIESGTVEMDPRTLRVMWPMSDGDPIGGVVSADELARRDYTVVGIGQPFVLD